MIEKIAIISDIHGNLEALNTVLEDIKRKNVDKIFCLGDIIAKGKHIEECVNIIKKECDVVVKGNCDEFFTKEQDLEKIGEVNKNRYIYNRSKLSDENVKYLSNLPYCYEFYMSGRLVRLFHATPDKIDRVVINEYSIPEKYTLFLPSENTISDKACDIAIYGHIHHQYMDKLYNKTLINAGSVGNSFDVIRNKDKDSDVYNTTQAHYVIITGDFGSKEERDIAISFESVKYDMDKELENQEGNNIEVENYIYEMRNGMYRNMEKVKEANLAHGINMDEF